MKPDVAFEIVELALSIVRSQTGGKIGSNRALARATFDREDDRQLAARLVGQRCMLSERRLGWSR